MAQVTVVVQVSLKLDIDPGVSVADVIDEMNYVFETQTEGVELISSEMLEYEER